MSSQYIYYDFRYALLSSSEYSATTGPSDQGRSSMVQQSGIHSHVLPRGFKYGTAIRYTQSCSPYSVRVLGCKYICLLPYTMNSWLLADLCILMHICCRSTECISWIFAWKIEIILSKQFLRLTNRGILNHVQFSLILVAMFFPINRCYNVKTNCQK